MKIGFSLPTMLSGCDRSSVVDWSVAIESEGFDTVGLGDRIAFDNFEMFTSLAAAAAVTERVRIAATIVVLPMHSEVMVAKQIATIDRLSDGRVTLGVGVGGRSEDYQALGASFDRRFQRLDDQVDRIRRLWAGESPGPGLDPVGPPPAQDNMPILSGALGPRSMARASAWADGVVGFELDPTLEALEGARQRMDDAWAARGRSEPYRMTSFWFALDDDAAATLHAYAMRYLGVFGEDVARAMADLCSVAGPEALVAAVGAAEAAGYDEIQLVPTTADPEVITSVRRLLA